LATRRKCRRKCKYTHNLSDHEDKSIHENNALIKTWRGECLYDMCPCKKFDEVKK